VDDPVTDTNIYMHVGVGNVRADTYFFTDGVQEYRRIFQLPGVLKALAAQAAIVFYDKLIHG
jgi:hypothetical protein